MVGRGFFKGDQGSKHEPNISKMTKFGADLIQSISALAHAQAKDVYGINIYAVDIGAVDPKAIRKKLDLTQDEKAALPARCFVSWTGSPKPCCVLSPRKMAPLSGSTWISRTGGG
jgi:hypothetical protein